MGEESAITVGALVGVEGRDVGQQIAEDVFGIQRKGDARIIAADPAFHIEHQGQRAVAAVAVDHEVIPPAGGDMHLRLQRAEQAVAAGDAGAVVADGVADLIDDRAVIVKVMHRQHGGGGVGVGNALADLAEHLAVNRTAQLAAAVQGVAAAVLRIDNVLPCVQAIGGQLRKAGAQRAADIAFDGGLHAGLVAIEYKVRGVEFDLAEHGPVARAAIHAQGQAVAAQIEAADKFLLHACVQRIGDRAGDGLAAHLDGHAFGKVHAGRAVAVIGGQDQRADVDLAAEIKTNLRVDILPAGIGRGLAEIADFALAPAERRVDAVGQLVAAVGVGIAALWRHNVAVAAGDHGHGQGGGAKPQCGEHAQACKVVARKFHCCSPDRIRCPAARLVV